ncbi:MAG TPA: nuclear transport factor 2 family protein [Sphingobacteriaceae bacterium]|nr:nuclear transport factor 2 family protein [Sphingobacteriaceae bacterium]
MKKILSLFILFTLSVTAVNAQSKDEKAVAAAVEMLNKGILSPEKNLLENIASDGLSYGHSGGKVQTKAEFVEDLVNGTFRFQTVNTSDQKITISGKNAIVRHVFIAKATNAGTPVDLRIGNLLVWKKEHGQWKLLARQAFKL